MMIALQTVVLQFIPCRHFGFVNFYMEVEAERAALKMSGFMIHGSHIKTKGPQALRDGNHFSPPTVKSPQQMQDFRPYTDCLFGPKCGKGIKVSVQCHCYSNLCVHVTMSISVGSQSR